MSVIDDRLNLILGKPVKINDFISVKQYTLREISDIGYMNYISYVGHILRSVDDMLKLLTETDMFEELFLKKHTLTEYTMNLLLCQDRGYKKIFEESLCYVLGVDDGTVFVENDRILYKLSDNDIKLVNENEFQMIMKVLKKVNGYESAKESKDENPFSDKTREFMEKMKRNREKVAQAKSNNKEEVGRDLADIISAVTVKSNSINKLNILDLTLYQIYDENSRLYQIEQYHLSIKASMFGGDGEITDWGEPQ